MTSDPGALMAAAAVLVLLGVVASKVSARLGVPALLLFLLVGMAAGSEGVGGIEFADYALAQSIGVVALAFILFAGGFDTEWSSVRPVVGPSLLLATAGVLVTALISGAFASWILDVSLTTGLLLGAVISSTDAAAVFSVLRSRSVSLRGRLRPLLELESGSNDPMAVFLTVGLLELLTEDGATVAGLLPLFVAQMALGGVAGVLAGKGAVLAINRVRLEYEGLYPVVMIALVLLTYGVTATLGGSGFLAVYVAGLVLGHERFIHKRSLTRFADGLAWLMQIAMFLVLGLLVFPSDLVPVAGKALLVSLVLIFVARPLAAGPLLLLAGFRPRETLMVSWVGLRGAVPIVLATFPLVEGLAQAELLFNVVFFIVLTSVLLQGTTIPVVARWLGVDAPLERRRWQLVEAVEAGSAKTDLHEVVVGADTPAAGRQIVDLQLPQGVLVVLVSRGGDFVVPQGSTVLMPGDTVLLLADDGALARARSLIEAGGTSR
ncbi:MAG TPA: potassium/proton antiporter [Acidimicrobiales bacterium]|nr:potassium/proton antiporter [Acidimicrobiales bacterium]